MHHTKFKSHAWTSSGGPLPVLLMNVVSVLCTINVESRIDIAPPVNALALPNEQFCIVQYSTTISNEHVLFSNMDGCRLFFLLLVPIKFNFK